MYMLSNVRSNVFHQCCVLNCTDTVIKSTKEPQMCVIVHFHDKPVMKSSHSNSFLMCPDAHTTLQESRTQAKQKTVHSGGHTNKCT